MGTEIERSKLPSVANLLLLLGLAALILSFFVPSITAERVARIERRGLAISRNLLLVALQMEPLQLSDQDSVRALITTLRETCANQGLPSSNLPVLAEDLEITEPDRIYLISKHYRFLLGREPQAVVSAPVFVLVPERRPLEVYAWPRDQFAAASSAFYWPEQGWPAYSRNLVARYRGRDPMPKPGAAKPPGGTVAVPGDRRGYRGQGNNERWLALDLF